MKNKMNSQNNPILCISVAEKPGKFGITVHNAGYRALGLNFMYKTFAIDDIRGVITGVRSLGIRGCSVSMPFKEKVIPFLDRLDPLAKKTGAVNTVVNDNGRLIGYNTDVIAVEKSLRPLQIKNDKDIIIFGAGGVSRAILVALKNLKLKNVTLTNRTKRKGEKLAKEFNVNFIQWSKRENIKADVVINATSIGMVPNIFSSPISKKKIKNSQIVMDVVVTPPKTKLIKIANKQGKITVDGLKLSLYQAFTQFKLYTGRNPPIQVMQKAANTLYKVK
jgi:shikimate dehydrogenase